METQKGFYKAIPRNIKINLLQALKRGKFEECEKDEVLQFLTGETSPFRVVVTTAKEEIKRLEALSEVLSDEDAEKTEGEFVRLVEAMGYEVRKREQYKGV